MPAIPNFSDEKKEVVDTPDIVIAQVGDISPKRSKTKKYVIISVSIILSALIILTAILVGIYMFTEAEKEIIKYTLNYDKNSKQDVTSDPNTNIVTHQVQNAGQKAWIVNDFNKDIQVVRIQTLTQTNCYVTPLNRTRARDPSQITGPDTKEVNKASTLTYVTAGTPISDTGFLAKAARDLCDGISTYWLYPKCSDNSLSPPANSPMPPIPTTPIPMDSTTTSMVDFSPWYIAWTYPYSTNTSVECVTGCCKTVCACSVEYYWYTLDKSLYCTWVARSCPTLGIVENPVSQSCSNGPTGLSCPNRSPATLPDC